MFEAIFEFVEQETKYFQKNPSDLKCFRINNFSSKTKKKKSSGLHIILHMISQKIKVFGRALRETLIVFSRYENFKNAANDLKFLHVVRTDIVQTEIIHRRFRAQSVERTCLKRRLSFIHNSIEYHSNQT